MSDDTDEPTDGDGVTTVTDIMSRRGGGGGGGGGRKARINSGESARRAFELRKAGATYYQIAQQCGYANERTAYQAVKRIMDSMVIEPAEELRKQQFERCNQMILVLWPLAQQGDTDAIRTIQGLMDKLDRYQGTEAPQQLEITHKDAIVVVDGDKDEFIQAMKLMAGHTEELPAHIEETTSFDSSPVIDMDDIVDAELVESEEDAFHSFTDDVEWTIENVRNDSIHGGDDDGLDDD